MQTVTHSGKEARYNDLLAELRDGLGRLQPEIPSKYLSDPALHMLQARVGEVVAHYEAIERPLLEQFVPPAAGRHVLFCTGNAAGRATTVGSVRMLRALRAGMRAKDCLVIGVDLRDGATELQQLLDDPDGAHAALHYGVLATLNERYDADFDGACLAYRVIHRPELNRLETRLVARRPHEITIDGVAAASLAKRDSILMSVRCTFTRGSLEALLNGVGLELDGWATDDRQRYAVAVAVPMRREP